MQDFDDIARIFLTLSLYSPILTLPLVFIFTKDRVGFKILLSLTVSLLVSAGFYLLFVIFMSHAMKTSNF